MLLNVAELSTPDNCPVRLNIVFLVKLKQVATCSFMLISKRFNAYFIIVLMINCPGYIGVI